ncbi:Internalin-A precursor [Thalassoglobus neptunius]|uniref:Internalin-A n=1 Tax=Thalassoglobus neptunius TaxID=1938619 RepID=A0A5C5WN95_9PLAN|nr:leucine-rich repeat domain-containing protein [Thalassoglobus neptunius]TWT52306.1 Internalin-A precursor [Thalassoglobus neptunius]
MKTYFLTALLLGFLTSFPQSALAEDVSISDPNLERVIRELLKKKQIEKEKIDSADLKTIYIMDARGEGIESLQGLEFCTNLSELMLSENRISDLSPIANLINIQSLSLSKNQIKSVKPLSQLVKLQYIEIEDNQLESLESLEGLEPLTNLRAFYAKGNHISDLSPLAAAEKLVSLNLNDNNVQDLSPIAGLKRISTLGLNNNQVSDFSPIADWKNLHLTMIEGNPIEDLSVFVKMARKDVKGERRFAPYWNLYLDVDSLSEPAKKQLERLKKLGVRIKTPS